MLTTIHFDKEDDLFVTPTIVISKIDTKVINKKIIIIIAFCILIFICLSILSLEIRNWIIDTAFENLKVTSN